MFVRGKLKRISIHNKLWRRPNQKALYNVLIISAQIKNKLKSICIHVSKTKDQKTNKVNCKCIYIPRHSLFFIFSLIYTLKGYFHSLLPFL